MSQRGRPSAGPEPWVLALDIGGTKLAAAAISQDCTIVEQLTTATYAAEGGDAVLRRLIQLAHDLEAALSSSSAGIGIASHGIIEPQTGTVRFASDNLPGWTGTHLKETVVAEFPDIPCKVANDGHAAVLAEHQLGCGKGVTEFAMLILGTGVGGGIISQGRLLYGAQGANGRIGHMSVDPLGRACSCGNRGCLEMYVSGTAIGKAFRQAMEEKESPGSRAPDQDVVKAANEGNPVAIEVLTQAGTKLGYSLVQTVRVFDPAVIAIGGGMASAGEWLLRPAREFLAASTPAELKLPEVRLAHLGANASLMGAGILGWQAIVESERTSAFLSRG